MDKKAFNTKFDKVIISLSRKVPIVGSKLAVTYSKNGKFNRFFKYGLWIMLEFWFVKGPMTWMFTDLLGIWYVLSAFIAGTICTIIGFFLSDLWIWADRRRKK